MGTDGSKLRDVMKFNAVPPTTEPDASTNFGIHAKRSYFEIRYPPFSKDKSSFFSFSLHILPYSPGGWVSFTVLKLQTASFRSVEICNAWFTLQRQMSLPQRNHDPLKLHVGTCLPTANQGIGWSQLRNEELYGAECGWLVGHGKVSWIAAWLGPSWATFLEGVTDA